MKRKILHIFLFICFSFSFVFAQDHVFNGIADLRGIDLNSSVVKLSGYWQFYWHKFIPPADFLNNNQPKDSLLAYVPALNPVLNPPKKLPDTGFATYHVRILLDTSVHDVIMRTPFVLTSEIIYVNGRRLYQLGNPYEPRNIYSGRVGMQIIFIKPAHTPKYNYIDLTIHVADYQTAAFGMKLPPVIGEKQAFNIWLIKNIIIHAFFIVLLAVLGFVSLVFLLLKLDPEHKKFFFYSLLFILITGIAGITENSVLLIPIKYPVYAKFSFIAPALYPFAMVYFIYYGYPGLLSNRFVKIVSVFSLLLAFACLILPSYQFTHLIKLMGLFILLFILCLFYKTSKSLATSQRKFILPFIGLIVLFLANIHDGLYAMHILTDQIGYITRYGATFFILILAVDQTIKFEHLFNENQKLTKLLNMYNERLGIMVIEKTKDLENKKQELIEKNKELQRKNEEIMTQKEQIEHQKALLEIQNKNITVNMEYAAAIQKSILPAQHEIDRYFKNFIIYIPRQIVSGDLYYFQSISTYRQTFYFAAVLDCTGHGISGAFMSLISYMILNQIISVQHIYPPQKILNEANRQIISFLHQKINKQTDGFDIALVKILPLPNDKFKVTFAGARLALFYRDIHHEEVRRIRGNNRSVGGFPINPKPNYQFQQHEVILSKGSMLWLLSDGYLEQVNEDGKKFGTIQLISILNEIWHMPVKRQKQILLNKFYQWKNTQIQRDDITIFALRLT